MIGLVTAVLDHPRFRGYEGGALVVLIALAEWANRDGVCWPSTLQIAERARLKPRQVYRVLDRLEEEGIVIVESGGGRGQRNRYRFANENSVLHDTVSKSETVSSKTSFSETMSVSDDTVSSETLSCKTQNPVLCDRANKEIPLLTANKPLVETSQPDFQLLGETESGNDEKTVEEVFRYYLQTIGKNPRLYTLTEKRKSMARARFRELCAVATEPVRVNAIGLMKLCVDRLSRSCFHQGDNGQRKKYLDWELLWRSREQTEKWLDDDAFAHQEAAS